MQSGDQTTHRRGHSHLRTIPKQQRLSQSSCRNGSIFHYRDGLVETQFRRS